MSPRPTSNRESADRTPSAMTERPPEGGFPRDALQGVLQGDRPSLRAETGAALERQLLLVSAPGDEVAIPGTSSRWPVRLALAVVLATLAASSAFFFVEVRGHWKGKVAALEEDLDRSRKEASLREEALRREAAEKDHQISERKAENQSLAALADKTLEELRTALADLRREREETLGLRAEIRSALENRPGRWLEVLAGFLRKMPEEAQAIPRPAVKAPDQD